MKVWQFFLEITGMTCLSSHVLFNCKWTYFVFIWVLATCLSLLSHYKTNNFCIFKGIWPGFLLREGAQCGRDMGEWAPPRGTPRHNALTRGPTGRSIREWVEGPQRTHKNYKFYIYFGVFVGSLALFLFIIPCHTSSIPVVLTPFPIPRYL